MRFIDLNADIGEADTHEWAASERAILDSVTSVNIACGGHAGDADTMRRTVARARDKGVVIGAHPAYPDREHFGRRSKVLGRDIDASTLRESLIVQIKALKAVTKALGATLSYIKPHGALYNDAVTAQDTATLLAEVIFSIDPTLIFMGAPHSQMKPAAQQRGLRFVSEGFVDRRYLVTGHLQSRAEDGAVLRDQQARIRQALGLALNHSVETATGETLPLRIDSLCVHGDSPGAVETARQTRIALEAAGVTLKAFAR